MEDLKTYSDYPDPLEDWKLNRNVECIVTMNKLEVKTPEYETLEFCRALTKTTKDMGFDFKSQFILDVLLNEILGRCEEKCGLCEEYVQQLRQHITQAHSASPEAQTVTVFKCDVCSSIYSSPSMLIRHRNTHSDEQETISTDQCENDPISPNNFEWNTLKHESSQPELEICEISNDEEDFGASTSVNHNPLAILQDMNNFLALAKNMKQEWDDVVCQEDFKDPLRFQDFELDFHVPSCVKYEYTEIPTEYEHRVFPATDPKNNSNHTDTERLEKQLMLGTRGKDFLVPSDLIRHKLTHTESQSHECDRCGEYFTTLHNLTQHKLTHSGEKPHECNVCGKYFAKRKYLTQHQLVHTGEKPHKCDVCGNCFTHKFVLTRHQLTHTGEKPFRCDVCGKDFTQPHSLKVHKLTHTAEKIPKRFKCDVCRKCFAQNSDLTRHRLTHAGEKSFHCDVYRQRFNGRFMLNQHKLGPHCLRTNTNTITTTFVNHLREDRESEEEGCQEDPFLNL